MRQVACKHVVASCQAPSALRACWLRFGTYVMWRVCHMTHVVHICTTYMHSMQVDDAEQFMLEVVQPWAQQKATNGSPLPVILHGTSMGGLVVRTYLCATRRVVCGWSPHLHCSICAAEEYWL